MMYKCKLTVLKTTIQKEIAEEYGVKNIGSCPLLKEGQIFYADYRKPDGFCDEAWKAIYQYVFALSNGAATDSSFYFDNWINPDHPHTAICSCNDGLRPVIIKVERTSELAEHGIQKCLEGLT